MKGIRNPAIQICLLALFLSIVFIAFGAYSGMDNAEFEKPTHEAEKHACQMRDSMVTPLWSLIQSDTENVILTSAQLISISLIIETLSNTLSPNALVFGLGFDTPFWLIFY